MPRHELATGQLRKSDVMLLFLQYPGCGPNNVPPRQISLTVLHYMQEVGTVGG